MRSSEHLLSRAIVKHILLRRNEEYLKETATDVKSVPGQGIEGHYEEVCVRIGRFEWITEEGGTEAETVHLGLQADGKSVVGVSCNGRVMVLFGLKDSIRQDSLRLVNYLNHVGVEVHVVSGDNQRAVDQLAGELGLPAGLAFGGCQPKDKLDYLTKLHADNHKTIFVGDGTNDAPVLAIAHVGMAIGTGTDIAVQAADVVLPGNRIFAVADALHLARRAKRRVVGNFIWSFLYNVVAVTLAAGVFVAAGGVRIPPELAGIGELASVLPVIFAALSLKWENWPTM